MLNRISIKLILTSAIALSAAFAQAQRQESSWVFNIEGYQLVYTYSPSYAGAEYLISHRKFSAKAERNAEGQIINKSSGWRTPGACTSSATFNPGGLGEPQVLENTNDIFEARLDLLGEKPRAFIRNRVTGHEQEGIDVYEYAADHAGGEFKLNHDFKLWKRCYIGETDVRHKEHFDNLARDYGVPIVDADDSQIRTLHRAWLFDFGGYRLVYAHHLSGAFAGSVMSYSKYKMKVTTDAFGDRKLINTSSEDATLCTGYADMRRDEDLPGPSQLSNTKGLFEVELTGPDYENAMLRNRLTGEIIHGQLVEDLAAASPDKTFKLDNRNCRVGDTGEKHKKFFKRMRRRIERAN